jgi:hypothetical protein
VIYSLLPRRAAIVGAFVIAGLPSAFAAPTDQDLLLNANPFGNYLAARHAGTERDSAAAATYYLNVLKSDPRNPSCSAAPSSPSSRTATSTRPASSPTGCCSSTAPIASRASWSASARSSRKIIRPHGRTFPSRCTAR